MSLQQSERREELRNARRQRLRAERREARNFGVKVVPKLAIDKTWTAAEDEALTRLYPDYQAMADVLRHRSYSACRSRCEKLGLRRRRHVWTTADQALLKRLWPGTAEELRAAFPGLATTAIRAYGLRMGLKPPGRPPLKLTGDPLCDAIRDRCRELGYTMIELDALARTGIYFQSQGWQSRAGHSLRPMIAAVRMLGGSLKVEWPD